MMISAQDSEGAGLKGLFGKKGKAGKTAKGFFFGLLDGAVKAGVKSAGPGGKGEKIAGLGGVGGKAGKEPGKRLGLGTPLEGSSFKVVKRGTVTAEDVLAKLKKLLQGLSREDLAKLDLDEAQLPGHLESLLKKAMAGFGEESPSDAGDEKSKASDKKGPAPLPLSELSAKQEHKSAAVSNPSEKAKAEPAAGGKKGGETLPAFGKEDPVQSKKAGANQEALDTLIAKAKKQAAMQMGGAENGKAGATATGEAVAATAGKKTKNSTAAEVPATQRGEANAKVGVSTGHRDSGSAFPTAGKEAPDQPLGRNVTANAGDTPASRRHAVRGLTGRSANEDLGRFAGTSAKVASDKNADSIFEIGKGEKAAKARGSVKTSDPSPHDARLAIKPSDRGESTPKTLAAKLGAGAVNGLATRTAAEGGETSSGKPEFLQSHGAKVTEVRYEKTAIPTRVKGTGQTTADGKDSSPKSNVGKSSASLKDGIAGEPTESPVPAERKAGIREASRSTDHRGIVRQRPDLQPDAKHVTDSATRKSGEAETSSESRQRFSVDSGKLEKAKVGVAEGTTNRMSKSVEVSGAAAKAETKAEELKAADRRREPDRRSVLRDAPTVAQRTPAGDSPMGGNGFGESLGQRGESPLAQTGRSVGQRVAGGDATHFAAVQNQATQQAAQTGDIGKSAAGGEQSLPQPMFQQLEEGLEEAYLVRPKSVSVQLKPAELGEVRVQVKMEGDQLQAQVEAKSAKTAALIREHQAELEQRMREQGIEFERFEVREDGHDHREENRERRSGQDSSPFADDRYHRSKGERGQRASANRGSSATTESVEEAQPATQPLSTQDPTRPIDVTI